MVEGNSNSSNGNVESFVLGLIIAVLVYLLLTHKLQSLLNGSGRNGAGAGSSSRGGSGGGGCGCGGGGDSQPLPENPGTSPGLNSLDDFLAFPNNAHSSSWLSTPVSRGSGEAHFGG